MLPADLRHHDLLQLLKAPMLLSHTEDTPVAKELPVDFEALMRQDEATPQNKRLGKYVEQLLGDYLQQHQEVSNFHKNLILADEGRTLGELDFVFDHKGQRYHWELAFKFYLLHQHQGMKAFFGPQGRDRLDLKINKLRQHQLPLIAHPHFDHLRKDHPTIQSELYVKGWLFYHLNHKLEVPDLPKLNPEHAKGWWLFEHELHSEYFESGTCFQIVEKDRWLTGIEVFKRFSTPLDLGSLARQVHLHFKGSSRSLMVYTWHAHTAITSRGFIVHSKWPGIT